MTTSTTPSWPGFPYKEPERQAPIRYRELDLAHWETRFLELLADRDGSIVHGKLIYGSLLRPPQYTALSYCWGDPQDTAEVQIDGIIVKVTKSLEAALRQLRRRSECMIWCDALCINQENKFERSQLVLRMGDVYSSARKVVAWLGPNCEDTQLAIEMISDHTQASQTEKQTLTGASMDEIENAHRHPQWRACRALFGRAYFERMWIIQEVAKATELELWCDEDTISIEDLERFLEHSPPAFGINRYIGRLGALREFRRREQQSRIGFPRMLLLEALLRCRTSRSLDPRDKLYAILGLTLDGAIFVRPNYDEHYSVVFEQANHYMIVKEGLTAVMLLSRRFGCGGQPMNKSWNVDWNDLKEPLPPWVERAVTRARETRNFKTRYEDSHILVRGVELDNITAASDHDETAWRLPKFTWSDLLSDSAESLSQIYDAVISCIPNSTLRPPRLVREMKANAVMLCCGRDSCMWTSPPLEVSADAPHLYSVLDKLKTLRYGSHTIGEWALLREGRKRWYPGGAVFGSGDIFTYVSLLDDGVRAMTRYDMQLAVTDRNFIRIVHRDARKGDRICRLENCSLPIILGERDTSKSWQVKGEVFLSGSIDDKGQSYWTGQSGWQKDDFLESKWRTFRVR